MIKQSDKVRVNIYILKSQDVELGKYSRETGESKGQLIRKAINDLLKKIKRHEKNI
jgi:hypothetical protein